MFLLLAVASCDNFLQATADGRTRHRSQYTVPGTLACRNSVFFKFDTPEGDGGVISISGTSFTLSVTECFFWDCCTRQGKGGVLYGDRITTLQFVESQIERCGAGGDYQALMVVSGDGGNSIDITLTTVYKCHSPGDNLTTSHVVGVTGAPQLKLSNANLSHNRVVGHGAGLSLSYPELQTVQYVNIDGNIGSSMLSLSGNQTEELVLDTVNIIHSKLFSERYGLVRMSGAWELRNAVLYDNGVDVKLCSVDETGNAEKSFLLLSECAFDGSWDSAGKEYLFRNSRREGAPTLASFELLQATVPPAVMNETAENALEVNDEETDTETEEDNETETKRLTVDQRIAKIEREKAKMPRLVDTVKQQELSMMAENSSHPSLQVMYPRFCCTCELRKKLAPGEKLPWEKQNEKKEVRRPRRHRTRKHRRQRRQ